MLRNELEVSLLGAIAAIWFALWVQVGAGGAKWAFGSSLVVCAGNLEGGMRP